MQFRRVIFIVLRKAAREGRYKYTISRNALGFQLFVVPVKLHLQIIKCLNWGNNKGRWVNCDHLERQFRSQTFFTSEIFVFQHIIAGTISHIPGT
jgi:hypothetical protein